MKLGKMLFMLPTLFTLSSVFLGILAITMVLEGSYQIAAASIVFAMLFDLLDGKVARLTRTQSEFGIQIDSLADIISFGVAPTILVYGASLKNIRWEGLDLGLGISFLLVAAGAIRLARYNVLADRVKGPVKRFVGLPIPVAAGTISSLFLTTEGGSAPLTPVLMATLVVALSLLMVSTVSYRKSLSAGRKEAIWLLTPLIVCIVALVIYRPENFIFGLLVYYISFGLVETALIRLRPRRRSRVEELNDEESN